ncbi:hypothetical protein ACOSQ4_004604 [Xanthoceras sorbifolium]
MCFDLVLKKKKKLEMMLFNVSIRIQDSGNRIPYPQCPYMIYLFMLLDARMISRIENCIVENGNLKNNEKKKLFSNIHFYKIETYGLSLFISIKMDISFFYFC